ncbi:hypothetical protein [Campylobacter sp. M4]|uniref:hypothetical protein n=1 Tax=Campylobacter sp. M4 TaxID=3424761 RepID=UPI003D330559
MGGVELIFSSEVLSYVQNYKELLFEISKNCKFFMLSLYIPDNPIGFVKSEKELVDEIGKNFEILEHISLKISKFVIIFAKSKF